MNGSRLDSQKTKRFLRKEFEFKKPDLVIFIRDLDSTLPNQEQVALRDEYFSSSNRVVDRKGIKLLHIYEIEALILADIELFNKIYECAIEKIDQPMQVKEPKEFLRSKAKRYTESDNPDIFKRMDFNKALNVEYFKTFITKLDRKIKELEDN